jgi:hypothetical protein
MSKRSVADWLSDIVSRGERLEDHLKGVDRDADTEITNLSRWP